MFNNLTSVILFTLSCLVFPLSPTQLKALQVRAREVSAAVCRCFPGDSCWPSASTWEAFNASVDGKLIATVPLASPCHDSGFATYNAEVCKALQNQWLEPQTHFDDPSSVMAPFFANRSCDPFTSPGSECVIGAYVQYAVNVSHMDHVAKTINFARERNIRLVIRNTGHE